MVNINLIDGMANLQDGLADSVPGLHGVGEASTNSKIGQFVEHRMAPTKKTFLSESLSWCGTY
jgi:hypothetical protein